MRFFLIYKDENSSHCRKSRGEENFAAKGTLAGWRIDATIQRRAINISSPGPWPVSSSSFLLPRKKKVVHRKETRPSTPAMSEAVEGREGQSERAAANEDVESSGARKMGRPAFHPPPETKGEGKSARPGVGLERAPKAAGASRQGQSGRSPAPLQPRLSCSLLSLSLLARLSFARSLTPLPALLSSFSRNVSSVCTWFFRQAAGRSDVFFYHSRELLVLYARILIK